MTNPAFNAVYCFVFLQGHWYVLAVVDLFYPADKQFPKPPGGNLEKGESNLLCVLRETKEETGVSILDTPQFVGSFTCYDGHMKNFHVACQFENMLDIGEIRNMTEADGHPLETRLYLVEDFGYQLALAMAIAENYGKYFSAATFYKGFGDALNHMNSQEESFQKLYQQLAADVMEKSVRIMEKEEWSFQRFSLPSPRK